MKVEKGSNYHTVKINDNTIELRNSDSSDYVWIMSNGNQHVIKGKSVTSTWYYLVQSETNLATYIAAGLGEMGDVIADDGVIGGIVVDHVNNKPDEIDVIWVVSKWQGKGYGAGLVKLAYQQSKHGIFSSDNIGTMFMRTLWSMYKYDKAITLVYNGIPVPRDSVKLKGLNLWYGAINLCDPIGPDFRFEWLKEIK